MFTSHPPACPVVKMRSAALHCFSPPIRHLWKPRLSPDREAIASRAARVRAVFDGGVNRFATPPQQTVLVREMLSGVVTAATTSPRRSELDEISAEKAALAALAATEPKMVTQRVAKRIARREAQATARLGIETTEISTYICRVKAALDPTFPGTAVVPKALTPGFEVATAITQKSPAAATKRENRTSTSLLFEGEIVLEITEAGKLGPRSATNSPDGALLDPREVLVALPLQYHFRV